MPDAARHPPWSASNCRFQDYGGTPEDFAAVHALQKRYKLTPLSAGGRRYTPPAQVEVAARMDTKTPPLGQVQKMDAGTYFGRLARLMQDNPPAPADAAMVSRLKVLGIEPGKSLDIKMTDPDAAKELRHAMGAFEKLEKVLKSNYKLPPIKKI